jgi:signal transduction histidine kinase
LKEGRPFIIHDAYTGLSGNLHSSQTGLASPTERAAEAEVPMPSWMVVPLLAKDHEIGMLVLAHEQTSYYTSRHADLAMAFANQAAVAIENARLYEKAQELAALQERQKLARELHDSVSQALYGIGLGVRTARALLDRDPLQAVEPLDYALNLTEAGLTEMRALIFELRPESIESEGLVPALTRQAAALHARQQIEVSISLGEEPPLSLETKQGLYRIAQEALHNIIKHARATHVELRMFSQGDCLLLEVKDNGAGFDSQGSFPGHLGLHSMRERTERMGGSLLIESAPGQGTHIRAQIPLT